MSAAGAHRPRGVRARLGVFSRHRAQPAERRSLFSTEVPRARGMRSLRCAAWAAGPWWPVTQKDTKRLSTTVCLLALQFNAVKKQFVATRKVPTADDHNLEDRTFTAVAGKRKQSHELWVRFCLLGWLQCSGSRHRFAENARSIPDIHASLCPSAMWRRFR